MHIMFVVLALSLPPFAPFTSFLFHSVNNSVTLFISTINFRPLPLFFVTLSRIYPLTVFAPTTQSIPAVTILMELILVFPLFAFVAPLHFCLSVYVLLLIPNRQIGQQVFYIFPFRFLFLRPNLTTFFLVAYTDLPILSATCCAVLLG